VSVAENGDYFQVAFAATDDGDSPYVVIQRQFEEPDDGVCYVETHDDATIGHSRVARAVLDRSKFVLKLRRKKPSRIEVTFRTTEQDYQESRRVLRIMIPSLRVVDAG
jgi:hypothetical protein